MDFCMCSESGLNSLKSTAQAIEYLRVSYICEYRTLAEPILIEVLDKRVSGKRLFDSIGA